MRFELTAIENHLEEAERTNRIEEITARLLLQRKSVYDALAEGALQEMPLRFLRKQEVPQLHTR